MSGVSQYHPACNTSLPKRRPRAIPCLHRSAQIDVLAERCDSRPLSLVVLGTSGQSSLCRTRSEPGMDSLNRPSTRTLVTLLLCGAAVAMLLLALGKGNAYRLHAKLEQLELV